ncbi:hypothetical protein [Streptomyces sp. NPDC088725]|uniref:hypothetical protein n=1 Tax=Streptomyces sp. NPDC088725 TaxID=3365873 RepID=UPI003825A63B
MARTEIDVTLPVGPADLALPLALARELARSCAAPGRERRPVTRRAAAVRR